MPVKTGQHAQTVHSLSMSVPAHEEAWTGKRVRMSVHATVGQTYAVDSEVFLDEKGLEFVLVKCHFHSKARDASPWVVELRNEEGDEDAPWTMEYLDGDNMDADRKKTDKLTGIAGEFQQPMMHYVSHDGKHMVEPLILRNEYKLGPTWLDFFKGSRKVARVYTYYYRRKVNVRGNELPNLLWLHGQDDGEEPEEPDAPGAPGA